MSVKIAPMATKTAQRHSRLGSIFGDAGLLILGGVLILAGMLIEQVRSDVTARTSEKPGAETSTRTVERVISESTFAEQIVKESNERRRGAGLAPLRVSDDLSLSARAKMVHLDRYDYWAQEAPDGTSPWAFLEKVGYRYELAGENLAKDHKSADGVVDGWMQSELHRQNLLGAGYTEMGIAARYTAAGLSSDSGRWMVVVHYAAPR